MSSSLPTPGGSANTWGTQLNDYLQQSLGPDGKLVVGATNPYTSSPNTNLASGSQPGLVQLAGDLGNTAASPQVVSTHLSSPLGSSQGGTGNGFTKFSGPTTSEKTFTLPDASSTILVSGGALGTPSSGTMTNVSGTAASLTAGAVTGLTFASGKTLTVNNILTLAGTDSTTMTFPSTSATIARTDAAQSFTGAQTGTIFIETPETVSVTSNAGTCSVSYKESNFTNSSAANMTITLATSSAVDGQMKIVRVYDFSAVAKTITWVNTENSTVTVPGTSNGSTTLPVTVGFMYNSATSKWRCVGSV